MEGRRKAAHDADVVLRVGPEDTEIRAHSLVLRVLSLYFQASLSSEVQETRSGTIKLSTIPSKAIEYLLSCIYGDFVLHRVDEDDMRMLIAITGFLPSRKQSSPWQRASTSR